MGLYDHNKYPRKTDAVVTDQRKWNSNWLAVHSPKVKLMRPQVGQLKVILVKQPHLQKLDRAMWELRLEARCYRWAPRSLMDPLVSGVCWTAATRHVLCHRLGHLQLDTRTHEQTCMNRPMCICWIDNACTIDASHLSQMPL